MKRRALAIIYAALGLNVMLLTGLTLVRNLEPVKHVRMTTQADGIIIFGQNYLGLMSIRIFPNWNQASEFLTERHLRTPEIDFVEPYRKADVSLKRNGEHAYYRILWHGIPSPTSQIAFGTKVDDAVMHAPDAESALLMYQYISHSKYVSSPFGFSVVLEN